MSRIQLTVGISTQFATEDLRIFAPAIAVREILERHTIDNIYDILKNVCDEWAITPSLSVTDSASNALGSSEKLVDEAADRLTRTLHTLSPLLLIEVFRQKTSDEDEDEVNPDAAKQQADEEFQDKVLGAMKMMPE